MCQDWTRIGPGLCQDQVIPKRFFINVTPYLELQFSQIVNYRLHHNEHKPHHQDLEF